MWELWTLAQTWATSFISLLAEAWKQYGAGLVPVVVVVVAWVGKPIFEHNLKRWLSRPQLVVKCAPARWSARESQKASDPGYEVLIWVQLSIRNLGEGTDLGVKVYMRPEREAREHEMMEPWELYKPFGMLDEPCPTHLDQNAMWEMPVYFRSRAGALLPQRPRQPEFRLEVATISGAQARRPIPATEQPALRLPGDGPLKDLEELDFTKLLTDRRGRSGGKSA